MKVFGLVVTGVAGALFAGGLVVSGMTQPSKVLAFLDVTGAWDASLAFVMAGAVVVYGVLSRLIAARRGQPWFAPGFDLPTSRTIDAKLVGGAAIFGVGWGLAGFCPGPALISASSAHHTALVFVAAMAAGMVVQQWTARRRSSECK